MVWLRRGMVAMVVVLSLVAGGLLTGCEPVNGQSPLPTPISDYGDDPVIHPPPPALAVQVVGLRATATNPDDVVMVGGVALVPLVIMFIEFVKRMVTNALARRAEALGTEAQEVAGDVWLLLAVGLCVGGFVLAAFEVGAAPVSALGWVALLVQGVAFGLAAGKVYDESGV